MLRSRIPGLQTPTDNTVMIELGTQLDQALHWSFIAAVPLGILAVAVIPLMGTQGSTFIPFVHSAETVTVGANAGMTLAFEPCMDCGGYPVVEEVSLARRR